MNQLTKPRTASEERAVAEELDNLASVLGLTGRDRMFCHEYIIDFNALQAGMRVGWSKDYAGSHGSTLHRKPECQIYINRLMQERSRRTGITAERVLMGLEQIAFGDMRKLFDDNGNLKKPWEIDDRTAQMLAGIDVVTKELGNGEVEYVAKIKTVDRIKALELLGKHLKLFAEQVDINITQGLGDRVKRAQQRAKFVEPEPTVIDASYQDVSNNA